MSKFISKLKFVPSLLTCSSAFCGILATIFALEGEKGLVWAAYLIFIAAVFDFSDGFAARLLGAASELGKQLDSLADAISFGVAPTAIMYQLLKQSLHISGKLINAPFWQTAICLTAALIGIFAILRLAKFNIDPEQAHSFKGLASPACAIFVASLALIEPMVPEDFWFYQIVHAISGAQFPYKLELALIGLEVYVCRNWHWLLPMCVFIATMMITNLPMFSLKLQSLKYSENKMVYNFVICSAILIFLLKWIAIPLITILYIAVSFIDYLANKKAKTE
jgi:CDP-diacylglycerol--serine O-phosphatidyltransferase